MRKLESRKFMDRIIKTIIRNFRGVFAVIDYSQVKKTRSSDVDIAIVVSSVGNRKMPVIRKQLLDLIKSFPKLDPIIITRRGLAGKEYGITANGPREFHGMDRYRIKRNGKVLYGPPGFVEALKNVSVEEALNDVLPYLRNNMVPRLRRGLIATSSPTAFVRENRNLFLVLVRNIYTIETGKISSKVDAVAWAVRRLHDFSNLLAIVKVSMSNMPFLLRVSRKEIQAFLDFAEKKFR